MKIILILFLILSIFKTIRLKEISEEEEYSPFSVIKSENNPEFNIENIDPIKNSIEISTITNKYGFLEKKKPIKNIESENLKITEMRKNFNNPASLNTIFYLNNE